MTPSTPTGLATPAGCTDLAGLVQDVTFPDGTPVVAGESFRKVWRLRNDGTCTWTPAYAMVFSSGDRMSGAAVVPLGTTVRPGETADLAIDLVGPAAPGTYRGYWLLRNDRGLLFGMPATGVNPLWLQVAAVSPGTTVTGGWNAEYFSNRNLSGAPTLTRHDAAINFTWGSGSSDPSLPADSFSVRWTGSTRFDMGVYWFHVIVDDGARLWVDGNLLLDGWKSDSARELKQDLGLTRGEHSLRLEYFENRATATARLYWEKVQKRSFPDWKAEFWRNTDLSGAAVLVRNDSRVSFDWGSKAPAAGVPADRFSARWTRTGTFTDGLYRFSLRANDGVRFYVNGTRLVDEWHTSDGTTVYTVERGLSGASTLRVDYYEDTRAGTRRAELGAPGDNAHAQSAGVGHTNGHDDTGGHNHADRHGDAHGHAVPHRRRDAGSVRYADADRDVHSIIARGHPADSVRSVREGPTARPAICLAGPLSRRAYG